MRNLRGPAASAAVIAAGALAVGMSGLGPASAAPQRHTLTHSKPTWANSGRSRGAVAGQHNLQFAMLLGMRHQDQVAGQIKALSDPSSKQYGHWLSGSQFNARYAPTQASVDAVESWARSQGLHVDSVASSRMLVHLSGTTATVNRVFATQMRNYTFMGHQVHANATDLSLPATTPAAVVGSVKGVIGLDTGSTFKKPADTAPPPAAGSRYGVDPCSSYFGEKTATDKPAAYGKQQPYAVCGYTPHQLQSAYGESGIQGKGVDGHGQTVVITDAYASPTIVSDLQKYNAKFGLPQFKNNQFRQVTPGPNGYDLVNECGGSGWYGEETLDIEAVHSMAPGAKIVYVGGADCSSGLDNAWAGSIDNHLGDIVTNSWGDGVDTVQDLGQSYIDFYQQYSQEAALRGMSDNFSSGDAGDQTAGGANPQDRSVSFPSDLPYVTAVGGTSLDVDKTGSWAGEWGWQSSYSNLSSDGQSWTPTPPGNYSSGGGGGTSQLFAQPWYQAGVVPTSVSESYGTSSPMRATPDIAAVGDPNTGFVVGQTQAFPDGTYFDTYRIGGTSLSSPLEAGMLAVANQMAGHPLGFVNPLYYKMLGSPALHDITAPTSPVAQVRTDFVNFLDNSQGKKYRLQTIDVQSTSLHDTAGWDDETGVGTPTGSFYGTLAALGK